MTSLASVRHVIVIVSCPPPRPEIGNWGRDRFVWILIKYWPYRLWRVLVRLLYQRRFSHVLSRHQWKLLPPFAQEWMRFLDESILLWYVFFCLCLITHKIIPRRKSHVAVLARLLSYTRGNEMKCDVFLGIVPGHRQQSQPLRKGNPGGSHVC